MRSHPNARLTQRGRLRLVIQQVENGRRLAELAAENGIILRCAYRWLATDARSVSATTAARCRAATPASASKPHRPPAPGSVLHRRQDWPLGRIGLGRLRNLEPKSPAQRHEWERPGDLIHIDVKSLSRFRKVGHRITGNLQQGPYYGVGYDKVHVAVETPPASVMSKFWRRSRSQR